MPPDSLQLPTHYTIEPELREQLGSRPGHQRCVEGDQELLLIVHEVPKPGTPEKVIVFWRRHNGSWCQPAGPGLHELEALLGRYLDVIDTQQEIVTRAGSAADVFSVIRHATPLARSLSELTKALEQALSFDPDDLSIRNCRDRIREIGRSADLLHADARATLDFLRTEQGEKLAASVDRIGRTVNRLSVLVIIFLPLAALGTFLGISPGIPWLIRLALWGLLLAGGAVAWIVLVKKRPS